MNDSADIETLQCQIQRPVMTESSGHKIACCEECKCRGRQWPACNCKPGPLHYLTKVISTGHILKHTTYTHIHIQLRTEKGLCSITLLLFFLLLLICTRVIKHKRRKWENTEHKKT